VAVTRLDRWAAGLALAVAAFAAVVVWASQAVVCPPRPRVSDSQVASLGLGLREETRGALTVARAAEGAARAGLRGGDRIVAIDELRNPSAASFGAYLATRGDGDSVRIEARRGADGVLADVTVVVRAQSPKDEGLPYEDVAFRNAAGLTLRGWYIPPPSDGTGRAPGIAWGHGNAADRRHMLREALAVHEAGFAQILFDFTGRGESDGDVITLGAHEAGDLRAALDVLTARPEVDPRRLALGGRSMGAVAAILEAADDPRVEALVLDSPYADLTTTVDRAIGAYHLPAILVRPVLLRIAGWRANYDPSEVRPDKAIRKVKAPILLLQGSADEIVPPSDTLALKAAAGGKTVLLTLPGQGHNDPRPQQALDRIASFLRTTLGN
jgi:dipeptidyl aminopeptidase/acylaminoacyl peptidase